jgi:hypothetical protein
MEIVKGKGSFYKIRHEERTLVMGMIVGFLILPIILFLDYTKNGQCDWSSGILILIMWEGIVVGRYIQTIFKPWPWTLIVLPVYLLLLFIILLLLLGPVYHKIIGVPFVVMVVLLPPFHKFINSILGPRKY